MCIRPNKQLSIFFIYFLSVDCIESLSFKSWESTLLSIFHSFFFYSYRFEVWTGHDLASFVDCVGCWLSEFVWAKHIVDVHWNHEMISFLGIPFFSIVGRGAIWFNQEGGVIRSSLILLFSPFTEFLWDESRVGSGWSLRRVQVN